MVAHPHWMAVIAPVYFLFCTMYFVTKSGAEVKYAWCLTSTPAPGGNSGRARMHKKHYNAYLHWSVKKWHCEKCTYRIRLKGALSVYFARNKQNQKKPKFSTVNEIATLANFSTQCNTASNVPRGKQMSGQTIKCKRNSCFLISRYLHFCRYSIFRRTSLRAIEFYTNIRETSTVALACRPRLCHSS